jgi:hypothetical protein
MKSITDTGVRTLGVPDEEYIINVNLHVYINSLIVFIMYNYCFHGIYNEAMLWSMWR